MSQGTCELMKLIFWYKCATQPGRYEKQMPGPKNCIEK